MLLLLAGCGGGADTFPLPLPPDDDPAGCAPFVEWSLPDMRIGGLPINADDIEKVSIYVSYNGDPWDPDFERIIDIDLQHVTSWQFDDIGDGEFWFWMKATTTDGLESPPSNIVQRECVQ